MEDPETVKAAEALQAAYRVRKNKKVLMVDNGTGEDKHIGGFHLQLFLFVFKFIAFQFKVISNYIVIEVL